MKYLSYCVLCAIGAAAPTHAGEWVFSPTVDVALHQSSISSEYEELERQDTVTSLFMENHLAYTSKKVESTLIHDWRRYDYSDTEDLALDYHDIRWDGSLDVWRDDWTISGSFARYHELFDTIQGSFVDEMYSDERPFVRYKRQVGTRYDLPDIHPLDFSFRYSEQHNDIKLLPEAEGNFSQASGYNLRSAILRLGQYDRAFPVSWEWRADLHERVREDQGQINNYGVDYNARIPVYSGWHAAVNGNFSEYESKNNWNFGLASDPVQHRMVGVGLAWVKSQKNAYIQVTKNWDQVRDEESWGVDAKWFFADRWSIFYNRTQRLYGDSEQGSLSYTGKHHQWQMSYSEQLETRFFITPEFTTEGVYICQPDDEGQYYFDSSLCVMPPVGDVTPSPGEALIPNVTVGYPLQSRITLNKEGEMRWTFSRSQWSHDFSLRSRLTQDMESSFQERAVNGEFLGTLRMNSHSRTEYLWRYRDVSFNFDRGDTVDRLYRVSYHYELNTKAEWYLAFQHIDKDSTRREYQYKDNRITVGYKHFFGKKHKDRRPLSGVPQN